jgi:ElaA protein
MEWKCSEFKHLSTHELYSILRARSAVFVVEYAHIHLDIDDKDQGALHIFGLESDGGSPQVVAYARLLPGNEEEPEVVIDKLLTVSKRRDDDTRDLLMTHALAAVQTVWPDHPIHINVSAHLEVFCESLGFRKAVGSLLDQGASCVGMAKAHAQTGTPRERAKIHTARDDVQDFDVAAPLHLIDRLGMT